MPTPLTPSATPALTSSVASPARAIAQSTPAAPEPLAAMWKAMLARVGSDVPVLVLMTSLGIRRECALGRGLSRVVSELAAVRHPTFGNGF